MVIDGYVDVPTNNEEALLQAVAQQPVSVAIDGGAFAFMFYEKVFSLNPPVFCMKSRTSCRQTEIHLLFLQGVFSGHCTTRMNHGVTIVGYGETSKGVKYWTVKNSWGTEWGEEGYIRIVREETVPEGHCGINQWASYPIKNSPNPTDPIVIRQFMGRKSGQSSST